MNLHNILLKKNKYWIVVLGLFLGCVFCILFLSAFFVFEKHDQNTSLATASILIIEATVEYKTLPTQIVTPTNVSTEYIGNLSVGKFVTILGTEGSGLRLRAEPGIDNQIIFIGMESEIFEILDGPIFNDDYYWWYIRAPYDNTRSGWAVADYLSIVQEQ